MVRLLVEGLACRRGGRLLQQNVTFALGPGQGLTLHGPNGIGKSSLLRVIAGIARPDAGRVRFEPEAEGAPPIAYAGHAEALTAELTLAEHFRFWARLLAASETALLERAGRFGLDGLLARPARTLSAGQRRRAALARTFGAGRPVLLLDEPTAALDAEGQGQLLEALRGHLDEGGLAIAATHDELPLAGWGKLSLVPVERPGEILA